MGVGDSQGIGLAAESHDPLPPAIAVQQIPLADTVVQANVQRGIADGRQTVQYDLRGVRRREHTGGGNDLFHACFLILLTDEGDPKVSLSRVAYTYAFFCALKMKPRRPLFRRL